MIEQTLLAIVLLGLLLWTLVHWPEFTPTGMAIAACRDADLIVQRHPDGTIVCFRPGTTPPSR